MHLSRCLLLFLLGGVTAVSLAFAAYQGREEILAMRDVGGQSAETGRAVTPKRRFARVAGFAGIAIVDARGQSGDGAGPVLPRYQCAVIVQEQGDSAGGLNALFSSGDGPRQ